MREGSGLVRFEGEFPDRYFDVGIAEQHALTFAAGAACDGLKPVVAIYSTFLQRAYDQLVHDISVQNLDVTFAVDRAGIVGADGPTHQGAFDLSFLRCLPNLVIFAPADEAECRNMLFSAFDYEGPSVVRYPRGSGPGATESSEMHPIPIGKAETRREGKTVALLAFGTMVTPATLAGDTLDATVVNMRCVKPLDDTLIHKMSDTHDLLVTIEENVIAGGAGSGVAEVLSQRGSRTPLLQMGLPDHHVEQGESGEVLAALGLDAQGIVNAVRAHQARLAPLHDKFQ